MPHIIVEYTDTLGLAISDLLHDLHTDLAGRESVSIGAIKTRAIPVKHCVVGEAGGPDTFIHIALKLLPGRSDELKKTMAQGLFDIAKTHATKDDVSLSVEVIDMHAPSYTK